MKKQIIIITGVFLSVVGFFILTNLPNSSNNSGENLFVSSLENIDVETTNNENEDETPPMEINAENEIKESNILNSGTVFVDVQGEVANPGVFEVEADARVGHVIELAGGLREDANVRGLNQAARVFDEMVIFVPHIDDVVEIVESPIPAGSPTTENTNVDSDLISLSTASALELQSLPGIGPAISANIIAHREENGPFTTVDELANVSGIGARIVENIRELVKP